MSPFQKQNASGQWETERSNMYHGWCDNDVCPWKCKACALYVKKNAWLECCPHVRAWAPLKSSKWIMSTKSIWKKRPWRDTEISKSKHKFEQNHCFQWHRLTSQLFPRRLQRMKWASVANEIVHPLLQLLEIPSQNSTDFLSRVISDMRSANYCNCVFRFPCIAPDASSAPTPNCCCAASLLNFFFQEFLKFETHKARAYHVWGLEKLERKTLLLDLFPDAWKMRHRIFMYDDGNVRWRKFTTARRMPHRRKVRPGP